ncbi:MAG: NAD-dependent epimerase/dehydratase family protein [Rhodanobacteraceae bacterium]
MQPSRRNLLKLSIATAAGLALRGFAGDAAAAVQRALRPLRILILGGTGFTGPDQVRYALARGHRVTVFNRGRHKIEWPGKVEELLGDRDSGKLKALEGRTWDVCIDNPTTLPFWVRDAGRVLRGNVKQYVFISTISVYADNAEAGADESSALAKYGGKDAMAETMASLHADIGGLYGPLKAVSEREAEKQFPGVTTIIRPGLIVGPGDQSDRFTYWPVRLARGGEVLAPGDGSDPVQMVDARDLAEWTIRMVEARRFGIYNATGPAHRMTMRDMLATIDSAIHARARLTWVPSTFLENNKVQAWSDLPVWVPAHGDSAGFARRSIKRALAAGLTFRPLAATAVDTLSWFRSQSAVRQSQLHAGLSREREQTLLASWHHDRSTMKKVS